MLRGGVDSISRRGLETHFDRVIPLLADDPDPAVQMAVIEAIKKVPGENIDRHLEVKFYAPVAEVR